MTPRYSIGDTVFFLENNSAVSREVAAVSKPIGLLNTSYMYAFMDKRLMVNIYVNELSLWFSESSLFPSKEELIKSL